MSRLTDIGVETAAKNGESAGSNEIDRSLGAVAREIGQSLAGWLFFVAAVELLMHGSHLIPN